MDITRQNTEIITNNRMLNSEMADCVNLTNCRFITENLRDMPATAVIVRANFCVNGKFEGCARYKVSQALGDAQVPDNLPPHGKEHADILLND